MPETESAGHAVAIALEGAWRKSPPPLKMRSESVPAIAPLLLASGAGALGWWRLRHSEAQRLAPVRSLRKTYLQSAIQAVEHERQVALVFRAFRSSGVEPILIKGWGIARAYAETGLRPSGDIDLHVAPEHREKALEILNKRECQNCDVDLDHDAIRRFSELRFDELFHRSELAELNGTQIRVLGAEDHLRLLCLHLLKHGAWRPLWLCDVAAALESRPSSFDWDRCLGRNKRWADWIACTIGLANRLLGAELGDAPMKKRVDHLPGWLIPAVLKEWSAPYPPNLPLFTTQLKAGWWKAEMVSAVRQRWPNPIQATVDADGRFDDKIRLPFQIRHCVARAVKLGLHSRS